MTNKVERMTSVRDAVTWAVVVLVVSVHASGCVSLGEGATDSGQKFKPSDSVLAEIRDEMRAWVLDDAIRRFAWDDSSKLEEVVTRELLCQRLLTSHREFETACDVTFADCLRALENPATLDEAALNRWAGGHRDVNRDQPKPDDAVWHRARWVREGGYWQQDVVWAGEAPRRGWNRADTNGLWGWDPKLPGDFKGDLDDDGQRGWRGTHVGYPFKTDDGCDCILWITPKEAYLECLSRDGIRTGAGLWHRYRWKVERN